MAPIAFKGLARGVHAARKHLLLALPAPGPAGACDGQCGSGGLPRVVYVTVGKEDGFGKPVGQS
jgi:hypothetical protein